jgi:hypothetical protein
MDLRFVAPDLRQIDTVGGEVLACALFCDERPPRGVFGLLDWRLAAKLSRFLEAEEFSGALDEVVLIPGKPRVPFEKIIVFGAGSADSFDELVARRVFDRIVATLSGLRVRMAVVERPGRHLGNIDASRGAELLLAACRDRDDQDLWTLVESPDDQKLIAAHMAEERRRSRMR